MQGRRGAQRGTGTEDPGTLAGSRASLTRALITDSGSAPVSLALWGKPQLAPRQLRSTESPKPQASRPRAADTSQDQGLALRHQLAFTGRRRRHRALPPAPCVQVPSTPLLLAAAAGGLAAAVALLLVHAQRRFERFLRSEAQAVRAAAAEQPQWQPAPSVAEATRGLPEPAARFLQRSIQGELPQFRLWVARGAGALRFDGGSGWKALASETVGALPVPAFCYTGTVVLGLAGLLACRGREALLRGRGAMEWRLWGALPLARSSGGRLDQSALLRWLAEAVCFPPALLPSPCLRWLPAEAGDPPHSARVVVSLHGGATAAATLTFDGQGRFVELRSGDYWRVTPDGSVACQPWHARGCEHRRFHLGGGCWVEAPTRLSVAWEEPGGGECEYIRFELTGLEAQ